MNRDQIKHFIHDQKRATVAAIQHPEAGTLIGLSVVAGLISSLALMRAGDKLVGAEWDMKKALRVGLTATISGLAFVAWEVYSVTPKERV